MLNEKTHTLVTHLDMMETGHRICVHWEWIEKSEHIGFFVIASADAEEDDCRYLALYDNGEAEWQEESYPLTMFGSDKYPPWREAAEAMAEILKQTMHIR